MYSGSRGLINELMHECNGYCQSIVTAEDGMVIEREH